MGSVVALRQGGASTPERSAKQPDILHASSIRCRECGGTAQLKGTRSDAFDSKCEIWTYVCADCGEESTARLEK